ncbi:hypothetical protein [Clavibacter michiganensis]|uniref:hypothetical protein n=1 Tax=Clavibacter michiganensis TaxID=28447 RepID=UPI00292EBCD6|nr:hypothetical protein [Clavibacter michiganensis]
MISAVVEAEAMSIDALAKEHIRLEDDARELKIQKRDGGPAAAAAAERQLRALDEPREKAYQAWRAAGGTLE